MQLKLSPHKTRAAFIPLTIQSAGDRPIIILMKMHQFLTKILFKNFHKNS